MSDTSFIYVADYKLFQAVRPQLAKRRLRSQGLVLAIGLMGRIEFREETWIYPSGGPRKRIITSSPCYRCEAYDTGRVYVASDYSDAIAESVHTVVDTVLALWQQDRRRYWRQGPVGTTCRHADMPERMLANQLRQLMPKQAVAIENRKKREAARNKRILRLHFYALMRAASLPTLPPLPPYVSVPETPEMTYMRQHISRAMVADMLAEVDRDFVRDVAALGD